MNNPRDILLKILEAIDYNDDKEAFVDEFLNTVQLQSIADLIQSLPSDKQIQLKEQLTKNSNDPSKQADILKSNFNTEQMLKSLENTSKKAVEEYVQTISSSLSTTQKDNLASFFEQFKPSISGSVPPN